MYNCMRFKKCTFLLVGLEDRFYCAIRQEKHNGRNDDQNLEIMNHLNQLSRL